VREEQERLRPDPSKQIDGEVLGQMQYTRQVVKELLRYRAPAPMVPQVGACVGGWVGGSVRCQGIHPGQ
jgi:cytochrome P450